MMDINRIVDHVKKHKYIYSLGAGITVAGITFVIMRDCIEALALRGAYGLETADTLVTNQSLFSFSPRQNAINLVIRNEIGRPSYLIHDLSTDLWYRSQSAVAKALGVSNSRVSNHLNGLLSHVDGHSLERVPLKV